MNKYSKSFVINTIENVKKFINITATYVEDIDIEKGRYVIDGKSIMGIFSLDISQPVDVIIRTEDECVANKLFTEIEEAFRG